MIDKLQAHYWITPSLVETRFSPDALVWVAVVFPGTAAWRNHGLIILPLWALHLAGVWQIRSAPRTPGGDSVQARRMPARSRRRW